MKLKLIEKSCLNFQPNSLNRRTVSNFIYNTNYGMIKIFFLLIFLSTLSFSQTKDGRYTKGAENGNVWIMLEQPTNSLTDYKYQYLSNMLDNQRYMIYYHKNSKLPIGCRDDIAKLGESRESEEFDLNLVVRMIDEFYAVKENLIIPIIGAYCYCVKNLAGLSVKELESYRQELIAFSKE